MSHTLDGTLRFNGAAARELRMPDPPHPDPPRSRASMGPQLVSCGCHCPGGFRDHAGKLQWGRSS